MKKSLSIILAVILILSVMMPVTVFAGNGPFPVDWDKLDLENLPSDATIPSISLTNITITENDLADLENSEDLDLEAILEKYVEAGTIYPKLDDNPLPASFKGISYSKDTNTLTLKNVRMPFGMLTLTAMGDDFKIKLVGYNELLFIMSDAAGWGGSITLTGSGELNVNKDGLFFFGIEITASETPAFFKAEKDVNLKVGSSADAEGGLFGEDGIAVSVTGSTLTDASKLIQLKGKIKKGGAIETYAYSENVYEQLEAYDFDWDSLPFCDVVLTKEGSDELFIGFESYDEETYEPNGKYYVFPVAYDEELKAYVCEAFLEENFEPVAVDIEEAGYEIKMNGAVPETIENIFVPSEKSGYDIALAEDGTKYCFEEYIYEDGEAEYTVYSVTEHSKYGYIVKEIPNKIDLKGLTAQKIGENHYIDAALLKTVVMNNGGSVLPGNVKGIKTGNTPQGVKIVWSPVTRATKYKIYKKAPGEKKWTAIATVDGTKTAYVDKAVKHGVKYSYTVKACNIVGWGSCDLTGVTTTFIKAPKPSVKTTTSGLKLSWSKISGADKYRIYRKAAGESEFIKLADTTSLSFTDKTVKNGKSYTYAVKAVDGKILSGYNPVTSTFVAAPKLSEVKNTATGVSVSWSKVGGATKYRVYRKASGETSWTKLANTTALTFTDTTAKSGKTYSYTVKAYNGSFASEVNPTGLSIKFLAPPSVKIANNANGVKLSWGKIGGAKEYKIYRKAAGETKWTALKTTTSLSFTDKTAKNGKTYSYAVKAVNGKTVSAYKAVKTLFVSTPALSGIKNTDSGVKFSWGKVAGATKYRVYRKVEGETKWTKLGDTTKLSFTDKTAKSGVKYAYTVKAYNGSYGSNIDSKGLKNVFVPTPGLNSLVEAEKKGVTVFWQKVSTADKYVVYRKVDGKDWEKIASIKKADVKVDQYGNLYYIDTTAKNNVTYSYTVKAYDGGYASSFYTNRYITYFDPVTSLTAKATKKGVTLKWDAVKGAESYLVLRKDKNSDGYGIAGVAEDATFIDETGESGTKYTYAVKACGGPSGKSGMSPTSKTVTITYK